MQQKTNGLNEVVQVGRAAKWKGKPIWDANLPVKEQKQKIPFKRFQSKNVWQCDLNYFFSSSDNNDTQSSKWLCSTSHILQFLRWLSGRAPTSATLHSYRLLMSKKSLNYDLLLRNVDTDYWPILDGTTMTAVVSQVINTVACVEEKNWRSLHIHGHTKMQKCTCRVWASEYCTEI